MAFILNFFSPFSLDLIADIGFFSSLFQQLREKFIGDFSECHLSFMYHFCKHITQNPKFNKDLNYFLRKELAKIKYTNIKKVSKAHLPGNHLKVEPDSYHDLL